jgi:hypothetical protein
MAKRNSKSQKECSEKAIARNLRRMQIERNRLHFRMQRAQAISKQLKSDYEVQMHMTTTSQERLLDQYEAFIADLEIYIDHYDYEIAKVGRGLEEATALRKSPAKNAFMRFILDDTTRTITNIRLANTEYKEILSVLAVGGFE